MQLSIIPDPDMSFYWGESEDSCDVFLSDNTQQPTPHTRQNT